MDLNSLKSLMDYGFMGAFSISIMFMVFKYLPRVIVAVNAFTKALENNTKATNQQTESIMPLKDQLEKLKAELERHDEKAEQIRIGAERLEQTQAEVLNLIREIYKIISKE